MSDTAGMKKAVEDISLKAKAAAASIAPLSSLVKNRALGEIATLLQKERAFIQQENERDLIAGRGKGLSPAMLDRLELSDAVIDSMIQGLSEVIALADPVGTIEEMGLRPNGLRVGRMRIPLGVIAMIYESRPNVTVDAAALCLKTGNAVILRGGSEAIYSNMALAKILKEGLQAAGLNSDAIQVIPVTDREAVSFLLQQEESIDLVIPRGGEGLIRYVSETSRIPVLKHYKGVCHIYVDKDADLEKAVPVILNAKTHRPGVCNALEGLLIHSAIAEPFVGMIVDALLEKGVEVRGCSKTVSCRPSVKEAVDSDWGTEFLSLTLAVKVVDDMDSAKEYILQYGSKHTEAILTENYSTAMKFITEVDASAVVVNASTRFNDGGQLGLGTEIGISTTKLHAYGPMGLQELTTRKFVVFGQGQVRD